MNMLHLVPQETGGSEFYARRLVPALLEAGRDMDLTLFAAREGAPSLAAEPWAGAVRIVELPVDARSRPRRVLVEQTLLPVAVRKARVDLLHNMFTTSPTLYVGYSAFALPGSSRRTDRRMRGTVSRPAFLAWPTAATARRWLPWSVPSAGKRCPPAIFTRLPFPIGPCKKG